MNRALSSRSAQSRVVNRSPWLEDEFVECYGRWREESTAVRLSYDRWRDSESDVESIAYAVYIAALDREERAADVYRECAHRIAGRE
jgi:hypothetical protein